MKHRSLREVRTDSGLPANQIAGDLELSRSQLYRIESGECQASLPICHRLRAYWPMKVLPDLAIYDPLEFERRRQNGDAVLR